MKNNFDKERKEQLKNKIFQKIDKHDSHRRIKRVSIISGVAASLALGMFFFSIYNATEQPSLLLQKAASSANLNNYGNEVKLILNNKKEVNIAEKKSTLVYSNNGKTVNINNEKNIDQPMETTNKISYNTIVVPFGKKSQLTLSDGSIVWLNSGSKLTYPSVFDTKKREVHLVGEAIFEVAHNANSPFHVLVDGNDIKVLGTIFNVSSYPDDNNISTALQKGSIEITYTEKGQFFDSKESLIISPGTLATYNKNKVKLNLKKVDMTPYFSWRDGVFIFKKNNLQDIMKKISRHYGVTITIADSILLQKTFSGKLDINNDLNTVMKIMKKTSKFEFEENANGIIITKPNTNPERQ